MYNIKLDDLNEYCKNSLIEHLGISFVKVEDNFIKATMPVDRRTRQPMGLLHGGAMLALAETVGSAGSFLKIDSSKKQVLTIQVTANHIGNTNNSMVYALGKIIHEGKRTHVWDVTIYDIEDKPLSVCRVTNMLLDKELL